MVKMRIWSCGRYKKRNWETLWFLVSWFSLPFAYYRNMQIPYFLQKDTNVSFLSAFKTGATARYFFDITTIDDVKMLPELFSFARESRLPVVIVGWGTNCLFAFDVYEGIFIHNRLTGYTEPFDRDGRKYIRIQSGEITTTLATKLYQNYAISTLVPWVWLPGTMGGACIGNAGCFGLEMADILTEVNVLDLETGKMKVFTKADMHYTYRESVLKGNEGFFVIDMLLDISPKWTNEYEGYTPTDLQALRRLKQPPGLSCGSFFKNPKLSEYHEWIGGKENLIKKIENRETFSAGKLIDEAGLKGKRVGGVHVSERHGNFLINDQKWSWHDILTLHDIIKETIREKYGIELHEEVRIISNV